MNAFVNAIRNTPDALTANGSETYSTTKNPVLDLFFLIGGASLKSTPINTLVTMFEDAYAYDAERAVRILLWTRDIRGGAGRREIFRQVMRRLSETRAALAIQILPKVAELGRWDDLLIFDVPEVKEAAYAVFAKGLLDASTAALAAKWSPRKGKVASELRAFFQLTPKQYRKLIVGLSNTVETKMCALLWEDINYSHVPSVASIRYAKAFNKHDAIRYQDWRSKLTTGETKVNVGAVYPHDVVVSLRHGDQILANEMWNSLPNFMGDGNIMPIVDISGSMYSIVQGRVSAMDISTALGIYCAQKNSGDFKNILMTFSGNPQFVTVDQPTLAANYRRVTDSNVGYDTNMQAAFALLLRTAIHNRVAQKDMPKILLLLSDMQFNSCNKGGTNFDGIRTQYEDAGYELPRICFWNIAGGTSNNPVQFDENNIALISGFSPAIMKSVLKAESFTPEYIMDQTIMIDRYNIFDAGRG